MALNCVPAAVAICIDIVWPFHVEEKRATDVHPGVVDDIDPETRFKVTGSIARATIAGWTVEVPEEVTSQW